MKTDSVKKLYTLQEACEYLSISTATGRNWMKSGRLLPVTSGKNPFFSSEDVSALKDSLSQGTISGLKSRRNKSFVSGSRTFRSYIPKSSKNHAALSQSVSAWEAFGTEASDILMLCLLRSCAEQLIQAAGYPDFSLFNELLDDIIPLRDYSQIIVNHTILHRDAYSYYPTEDTLGYLYLSLQNLRECKNSGSYYTPTFLAIQLITRHLSMVSSSKTVLDPSCGTGMILLNLPAELPLSNIYGKDLNPLAVTITRINLALKYHVSSEEELRILRNNITVSNFLCENQEEAYDIILGNPPWGVRLSNDEKRTYQKTYTCAKNTSSVEIYDLFIEQSIRLLKANGILSFILPEALLCVKAHTPIRKLLLQNTAVISYEYLGEVFEQVHCPSMILTLTKTSSIPFYHGRIITEECFPFHITDEDYYMLQKIEHCPNHTTLAGQADFALGIVTGNNSTAIHSTPDASSEPIIKGRDISKYHINSYSGYITFLPEQFQQTAPEQFYRAKEKLVYRFINNHLIFAYDTTGLLTLNSCNILIPRIPGLSVKYILAVLNSKVAQFFFEKKFRSTKVLRSHLEQIPIPLADIHTQKKIEKYVDLLLQYPSSSIEFTDVYNELDTIIRDLYHLS